MSREYTVIVERGESGMLIGTVPSGQGCFTQGKDLAELIENVKEVLALCREEIGADAEEPAPLVGVYRVAV